MDDNGKQFARTMIYWLVGLSCAFLFIALVMLISSGILGPDQSPDESLTAM